jgi:DNA repair exonuclease SbcCD ATPase subunit
MVTESLERVLKEFNEERKQVQDEKKALKAKSKQQAEELQEFVVKHLAKEIKELREDKKKAADEQQAAQALCKKQAVDLQEFVVKQLAKELTELREDRKTHKKKNQELHEFVIRGLSAEITEFAQERKQLTEARVKMLREGREKIEAARQQYLQESAKKLGTFVHTALKQELTQLKEDITEAKKNTFGRKIQEAFAAEFAQNFLSESAIAMKLKIQLETVNKQLSESKARESAATKLVEQTKRKAMQIAESAKRTSTISGLLRPLNESKAREMKELLDGVPTEKLKTAFDKYLPAVLNGSGKQPAPRATLNESVVVHTGDKKSAEQATTQDDILEVKRLAGLK